MDNYYKSKEFKEILAQYESLPDDTSSLSQLATDDICDIAQYYHEKRDDKKALKIVNDALEIYPGSVGPTSFLSRYAMLEEHDISKAAAIADTIADKNDPDYILLEAEIMIVDGRADEADDYLEEAYGQFYDDEYYDDMPLDVAILFSDYAESGYAEKWLKRSDETDEPDYKEVKAKILTDNGEFDEAQSLIEELINGDPYSSEYWDLLAEVQMLQGKTSDSITSSDYALAIDPDDRNALMSKANGMMSLENFQEAERLFRRYAELDPEKDASYNMIALSLMAQDRLQEAVQFFIKALEKNRAMPGHTWMSTVDLLYQLAFLENSLEHFGKVHDYLDRIAELIKDNLSSDLDMMGSRLAEIDCAQGHVCLEEDKIDEALEWFDQAVNDSNGKPSIYIKIAASSYESGYVQYAYNILHELMYNLGNDDELGFHYLALCCKHLGKETEQEWAEEQFAKCKEEKKK